MSCIVFLYESVLEKAEIDVFFALWGIGIVNAGLNVLYATKLKLKDKIFVLLVVSGLPLAFPPLLFSFFGIPCLVVFLVIGIYMQLGEDFSG